MYFTNGAQQTTVITTQNIFPISSPLRDRSLCWWLRCLGQREVDRFAYGCPQVWARGGTRRSWITKILKLIQPRAAQVLCEKWHRLCRLISGLRKVPYGPFYIQNMAQYFQDKTDLIRILKYKLRYSFVYLQIKAIFYQEIIMHSNDI